MVKLSDDSEIRVKWAAANLVQFEVNREKLLITKKDLLSMFLEIKDFMNFYNNDFSPANINKVLEDYKDDSSVD
jgi:hypothetical protein